MSKQSATAIADRVALRDAVCDYANAEKARGTPAATVLQTVTEILRKAERGAEDAAGELAQLLIDWCLEFRDTRPLPDTLGTNGRAGRIPPT